MSKLIPKNIIQQIKHLRQKGYSLPEIQREVKVGYGSVYRYINGIKILPEYKNRWFGKRGGSIKRMKKHLRKAEEKAKKTILSLSDKEKIIFLSALYWGEGGKSDFNLTNTDSDLIKVFVKGLNDVFGITKNRLRISIRIYEDLDKERCLKYWSDITGVPIKNFVNVNILKGKKMGKLSFGMCRLRITKGGDVLKYIQALYKRIAVLF